MMNLTKQLVRFGEKANHQSSLNNAQGSAYEEYNCSPVFPPVSWWKSC